MKNKAEQSRIRIHGSSGQRYWLWSFLLVFHFQSENSPADQLAFKSKRVDLVGKMLINLGSASEAEKSSVMAITDQESQTFADQSRAASDEVQRELGELELAFKNRRNRAGKRLCLPNFQRFLHEFRKVDNNLLEMAVRNTNLKASSLTYGPAGEVLNEMDFALSRAYGKI